LPLSKNAIEEAKQLMMSDKNMLRPADGSPMAAPATKEIALGVYYLTSIDDKIKPFDGVLSDPEEAILAYQIKKIRLRQKINVRIDKKILETTVGRIFLNEVLPENYEFVNENVSSDHIKKIIDDAYAMVEHEELVKIIDAIKDLGFIGGTISGLSFGITDAVIYRDKDQIIKAANEQVAQHETSFAQGLITAEEKKRLVEDVWIEATEQIADKTWALVEPGSSIDIMVGAKVGRASRDHIKQLSGMIGLVVDPLGKIVELPVKSNFREGMSVFEYATGSRGARKGLTDTALKTADAGYLTRRLVDVAHDMIVRDADCGTDQGIIIGRNVRPDSFGKRIVGRVAASDITDDKNTLIVGQGEVIGESKAREIFENKGVTQVHVFSPLTCESRYGVCSKCYGWDLSTKKLVEAGVPVGVLAAQSIGEPGTQLTMRTKHTGGVVGIDVTQGLPRVEELFESRLPKTLSPLSEISGKVKTEELPDGWKVTVKNESSKPFDEREYIIPKTSKLLVSDGQLISAGEQLAEGFLDVREILLIRGLKQAQEYLVTELQAVYESQGIPIADKHFETIVRKMSDEVKILTAGDTELLPGEQVEKARFEKENEKVLAAGGEVATAQQIILGITRRAMKTESWLSAASFQQTTDVLSYGALVGRNDELLGLKENVIIGRLIPVKSIEVDKPEENIDTSEPEEVI
jgi:DNA-directed RNA polymerase subunit beta'